MIDAHAHIWRLSRGDYGFPTPELTAIYRDFEATDLETSLFRNGIDRVVLVQAAASVGETEFLLSVADENEWVGAVVGWIDAEDATGIQQLEAWRRHSRFRGIRPMLQDIADDHWIQRKAVQKTLTALTELDLSLDCLVLPRHLRVLLDVLEKHPNLAATIDHCAKPAIKSGQWQPWADDIREVAANTAAYCKLSGLVTEAASTADQSSLAPYVEHVLECFGSSRVMFGSDWPVVTLASEYDDWLAMAQRLTSHLCVQEHDAVFGGNAEMFYNIRP